MVTSDALPEAFVSVEPYVFSDPGQRNPPAELYVIYFRYVAISTCYRIKLLVMGQVLYHANRCQQHGGALIHNFIIVPVSKLDYWHITNRIFHIV